MKKHCLENPLTIALLTTIFICPLSALAFPGGFGGGGSFSFSNGRKMDHYQQKALHQAIRNNQAGRVAQPTPISFQSNLGRSSGSPRGYAPQAAQSFKYSNPIFTNFSDKVSSFYNELNPFEESFQSLTNTSIEGIGSTFDTKLRDQLKSLMASILSSIDFSQRLRNLQNEWAATKSSPNYKPNAADLPYLNAIESSLEESIKNLDEARRAALERWIDLKNQVIKRFSQNITGTLDVVDKDPEAIKKSLAALEALLNESEADFNDLSQKTTTSSTQTANTWQEKWDAAKKSADFNALKNRAQTALRNYELAKNNDALPRTSSSPASSQPKDNFIADPVDITSGAFLVEEIDITISSSTPALTLKRYYNSLATTTGDFGFGWSHNHFHLLSIVDNNGVEELHIPDNGAILIYTKEESSDRFSINPLLNPNLSLSNDEGLPSNINPLHSYAIEVPASSGRCIVHTASDGSVKTYETKAFGNTPANPSVLYLKSHIDINQNSINYTYGTSGFSLGKLIKVSNSIGHSLSFEYNGLGYITKATTHDGYTIIYTQDDYGDLKAVTFPNSSKHSYTYLHWVTPNERNKSTHLIHKQIKPYNDITENAYDNKSRVISQKICYGESTTTQHHATFSYTPVPSTNDFITKATVTTPEHHQIQYYLYRNKIYKVVDPLGEISTQTWFIDEHTFFDPKTETLVETSEKGYPMLLKSKKSKRGVVTSYTYDDHLNIASITTQGKDLTGTGVNQKTTGYAYEEKAPFRLLNEAFVDENSNLHLTEYTYLENNLNPSTKKYFVNGALTKEIQMTYSTHSPNKGKLVAITTLSGEGEILKKTAYTYNAKGLLEKERQYIDASLSKSYDTTYVYNDRGLCIEEKLPSGDRYTLAYDGMNRLTSKDAIDASGKVLDHVEYTYRLDGKLESAESFYPGDKRNPKQTLYKYDHAQNIPSIIKSY